VRSGVDDPKRTAVHGEPADGAACDSGPGIDRAIVIRVDEDADDRVVPASVQVEQAGVGVMALADEAALVGAACRPGDDGLLLAEGGAALPLDDRSRGAVASVTEARWLRWT